MMSNTQGVTELVVCRQAILTSFDGDEDEAADAIRMTNLDAVENQIEQSTFDTNANKLAGLAILMEAKPERWDDFQENLFLRMQQFA